MTTLISLCDTVVSNAGLRTNYVSSLIREAGLIAGTTEASPDDLYSRPHTSRHIVRTTRRWPKRP